MNLLKKLIDILKRIGVLNTGVKTKVYKNSKDAAYEVDSDDLDDH